MPEPVALKDVTFKQVHSSAWETPIMGGYLLQCCDCGLVHKMDFRVIKRHGSKKRRLATVQGSMYKVQYRAYRVEPDE